MKYLLYIALFLLIILNFGCYSKYDSMESDPGVRRYYRNIFYADNSSERWEDHDWVAQDQGLEAEDWED